MPNDAKLGLVMGLGVVIAVAVLYHRQDPPAGSAAVEAASPAGSRTPAQTTSRPRRHTTREGDTLTALAQHYYGDPSLAPLLQRANADIVGAIDEVPAGTILLIPEREANP